MHRLTIKEYADLRNDVDALDDDLMPIDFQARDTDLASWPRNELDRATLAAQDPDHVGGMAFEPRRYAPEPAAPRRVRTVELYGSETPASPEYRSARRSVIATACVVVVLLLGWLAASWSAG